MTDKNTDRNVVERPEKDMSMYPKPDMEEWSEIWNSANIQKPNKNQEPIKDDELDVDTKNILLYDTMPLRKKIVDRHGIEFKSVKFDIPTLKDQEKFDKAVRNLAKDGQTAQAGDNIHGFIALIKSCSVEPKLQDNYLSDQIIFADLLAMMEKFNRNIWLGATTKT